MLTQERPRIIPDQVSGNISANEQVLAVPFPSSEGLGINDPIYGGLFPPKPNLDFESLPPRANSEMLKNAAKGKNSSPIDISGMPNHDDGFIRTLANYALPFSPSETDSSIVLPLRSIIRHDHPVPVGLISYETGLDTETIISFVDTTVGEHIVIDEVSLPGEMLIDMPNVKDYIKDTLSGMNINELNYTDEERIQVEASLRELNLLPRFEVVFSAD